MGVWEESAARNRAAWNEIAEVRARHFDAAHDAAFFARGGITLDDRVRRAAGDVRGRSLLHLQCASGEESLSWAVLGAKVTGVDISDRLVAEARAKADRAGLSVRYVAADVGELPAGLTAETFDITYTAGGVLVWMPDIRRWARVVAASLRPGGRFILYEIHPVAGCLWGTRAGIEIVEDYFSRGRPSHDTGWSHFPGAESATATKAQFQWPLGDIVTALVDAGLVIRRLTEYPVAPAWRYGPHQEGARKLPGEYLLIANKPDSVNAGRRFTVGSLRSV